MIHFHHAHLFAADVEESIVFYRDFLGGEVVLDMDLAGARNVFMKVGDGRLHFYDQPPRDDARGVVHHLGMQVDDLAALVAKMQAAGHEFRKPIMDLGFWKYVMASAPDGVLLELFEVDKDQMPEKFRDYFS